MQFEDDLRCPSKSREQLGPVVGVCLWALTIPLHLNAARSISICAAYVSTPAVAFGAISFVFVFAFFNGEIAALCALQSWCFQGLNGCFQAAQVSVDFVRVGTS